MNRFAQVFSAIAAVGFVASVVVNVTSWLGLTQPFGNAAWGLHVGIFVVWFPAVLGAQKLTKNARQADFWKAVLRGAPRWMRYGVYGLFPYTFVNFFAGLALGTESDAGSFRVFSGHWMLFYFAAYAMLTSISNLGDLGPRLCPSGHDTSPFAKFCEECGLEIPPDPIA